MLDASGEHCSGNAKAMPNDARGRGREELLNSPSTPTSSNAPPATATTDGWAEEILRRAEANIRWWLTTYAPERLAGPIVGILRDALQAEAPINASTVALDLLREQLVPADAERAQADRAHYGETRYAALATRESYVQRGLLAATGAQLVDEIERRLR